MIETMKLLQAIRAFHIDPLAAVIVLAVMVAWLEQRRAARHTPSFTTAHRGVAGIKHGH